VKKSASGSKSKGKIVVKATSKKVDKKAASVVTTPMKVKPPATPAKPAVVQTPVPKPVETSKTPKKEVSRPVTPAVTVVKKRDEKALAKG